MKHLRLKVNYTLCILLTTCLISCAGFDEYACYESVIEEFPNAITVKRPIGKNYSFVVVDADSSIYFVRTMNYSDADITQKELIYKWNQSNY